MMIPPRAPIGKSSIEYLNADDKAKPRVQRYRIFADMPIARPKEQLPGRSSDRTALASLPACAAGRERTPLPQKGTILRTILCRNVLLSADGIGERGVPATRRLRGPR